MTLEDVIKNNEGTIVDVRTIGEFMGGNVAGSKNIPLNEIPSRMEEIKALKMPLVLCCASGNRSGQATAFLKAQGVECYNGGSWLEVNFYAAQALA
ncbi:MAG: rhodanese-like domain-containing protein [Cytophagaceae bacterium]|nr:rhodanese-like domain-containing protein [Cytophagaceae bacterium]MBK9510692.1 rhodanese-like domain-containing protein [Cytophagaceae bacterium]MBK9934365.1 rhodanese-like domain-containing protein [Cytophagaceae bacterium]MBL0300813.1 rhodanese-like domain-containing protein [Cytophagaceae bacterium]MBL0327756.1 rhodanese-like domain-containing protein [Cytophagaceae bacterium]